LWIFLQSFRKNAKIFNDKGLLAAKAACSLQGKNRLKAILEIIMRETQ
jgi:hypothetical protein